MTAPLTITDDTLQAYADGRLDADGRAAVEAHLEAHPDLAAELALWQRQRDAIKTLYDPVAGEPVPARLNPHRLAAERSARAASWPRMAAAAVVLIGLGLGAGWFARDLLQPEETPGQLLIASAVNAHALYVNENRHAVEVAAADKGHLTTWLSNRLNHQLNAPDLSEQGFLLVGGRLLPPDVYRNTGPAAQLMYENATKDRLTVYVTAALPDKSKAYQFETVNGLDAFYWANDTITCTVVGDLPQEQMQTVARLVYRQLTRLPDPVRG
ncbi:anti-sigma factor family protein [Paradevosia shaoguanensis]|uniref:anti-sigma factor family protein n=1 Tax=Paradevosia shaoguanensis TaxID=1335043 RepID=UPI001932F722|nr:anti-sigma factor [Paradevosia shaoguanensis]